MLADKPCDSVRMEAAQVAWRRPGARRHVTPGQLDGTLNSCVFVTEQKASIDEEALSVISRKLSPD